MSKKTKENVLVSKTKTTTTVENVSISIPIELLREVLSDHLGETIPSIAKIYTVCSDCSSGPNDENLYIDWVVKEEKSE